jgi:hypothetical protein
MIVNLHHRQSESRKAYFLPKWTILLPIPFFSSFLGYPKSFPFSTLATISATVLITTL